MSFYGMATWHLYNVTVMQRFEAARMSSVNYFGLGPYARLNSVT